jgi:hypothetical protein
MANSWVDSVKQSRTLTIFPAGNASTWRATLDLAIFRFNDLSSKLSLGVTYAIATNPPSATTLSGAQVQFSTANGPFSFTGMGITGGGNLPGNASGATTRKILGNSLIEKAFIFVPLNMSHSFLRLCVVVHELVHAAGLDNTDHSRMTAADSDIFCAVVQPSGTGVEAGSRVMPPIWMTFRTADRIKPLWS